MTRYLYFLLLLAGLLLSADNLLRNPEFFPKEGEKSVVDGWRLPKDHCQVSDGALKITLKPGQTLHLYSDVVNVDQTERRPIQFGLEYKGRCKTKSWEHCAILADLTYQDGSKEAWPPVTISLPSESQEWQKLVKTVNLPKPVKSFSLLVYVKDEADIELRAPFVMEMTEDGKARQITVVLPDSPSEGEEFAAKELTDHIVKMTGERPRLINEKQLIDNTGGHIFLGQTQKSMQCGYDFSRFESERWQISSVGTDLLIGGGGACGTLYGVYHYLEDVCGVRWFTPSESHIPKLENLSMIDLHLSGKPVFTYRNLYTEGHDYDGHFLCRHRQNVNYSGWKFSMFGAISNIGPNNHSHCIWLDPNKYFATNPEYYALNKDGKRTKHALCLMNKETRKAIIGEVRERLRKHRESGKPILPNQPIYISHMDNHEYCHCKDCTSFAENHGNAISACDLDFINEIASELKEEFPNVIFMTLAYTYTEKPPTGLKAADNVGVELTDTTSSYSVPITHPDNVFFHDALLSWSKISSRIMVYDYWINYNFSYMDLAMDLPWATIDNVASDLRFLRRHGVAMLFSEAEFSSGTSDCYDYKVYMLLKLMENPYLDIAKVSADFADEFYGAAGRLFLEYRRRVAEVQRKWHPFIDWNPMAGRFTYLNLSFLEEMQKLFDQGEVLLSEDAVRLARWRRARISLDRAVCMRISYIIEEFLRTGRPIEEFPFDLDAINRRLEASVKDAFNLRYVLNNLRAPQKNAPTVTQNLHKTFEKKLPVIMSRLQTARPALPESLPTGLAGTPLAELHIFPLSSAMLHNETKPQEFKNTIDKTALFGCCLTKEFNPQQTKFGREDVLQAFTYNTVKKQTYSEIKLPCAVLDTPEWHWVYFGKIKAECNTYLALTSNWHCQFDLSCLAGPEHATREYDLWARVQFKDISPEQSILKIDSIIVRQ